MASDSLVNLDPIASTRKRQDSVISRLFKTRHYGGKGMNREDEFGHYLVVGRQGSGKTSTALWMMERWRSKYEKQKKHVNVFSNMGVGFPVNRESLHSVLYNLRYDPGVINIFILDEIQSYFPKDTKDKITLQMIDQLTGDFSQLRKRQAYVISTAQVFGRLNKNLREQCLYMVSCRRSKITNRIVSDFIAGEDVLCDDLGRWSGIAKYICVHGVPKTKYDTHALILS